MIGERIKELREEKGISQSALAKETGISQSKIARYELNKTEPKASEIKKFADFFDVTADWLIEREKW